MDVLDRIMEKRRERLGHAKARTTLRELRSRIGDAAPPLDFRAAVTDPACHGGGGSPRIRLIAEVKRASPSRGTIRERFDPLEIARTYERGADAISVLTEEDFFLGSLDYVGMVKRASTRPVLRKDFILDEYQIYESRAAGADAILLIDGVLDIARATGFIDTARGLGLGVLFEVHDLKGLDNALRAGADVIGVNNRDLTTFNVDINTTLRLKREIPEDRTVVGESGIRTRADVLKLEAACVDAVLVGTAFMEAPDIGAKVSELMGASQ